MADGFLRPLREAVGMVMFRQHLHRLCHVFFESLRHAVRTFDFIPGRLQHVALLPSTRFLSVVLTSHDVSAKQQ